jgi:hypothetical protein
LDANASGALREQILDRLVEVWRQVAEWKVVWGPRGIEELVTALGALGREPALDPAQRNAIARALQPHVSRLSVVRALGRIAASAEPDDELRAAMQDAAQAIIKHWSGADVVGEERRLVLESLAAIAAALRASPPAERIRRRVAESLFGELREEHFWARVPLEKLRDAKGCPRGLRQEISSRLAELFALVKVTKRKS